MFGHPWCGGGGAGRGGVPAGANGRVSPEEIASMIARRAACSTII
jgi:hypothetical protein